jgi:hypothetical protein
MKRDRSGIETDLEATRQEWRNLQAMYKSGKYVADERELLNMLKRCAKLRIKALKHARTSCPVAQTGH